MEKARQAGIHGDYLRQDELMKEIGKLIYGNAYCGGLHIKNTDTWDTEDIEI
nr:MAG TPA: hypothetical protein [Caudoviricetes sp.]